MNGTELLAEFKRNRSEEAFSGLVRHYTNLVYSAARRRLSNDALAQDATQSVFIRLARALPNFASEGQLMAWLHRTTMHVAVDLCRSEIRRRAREEQAVTMQETPTESTTWQELAPVLDEALNDLNHGDRQVVLLRFFGQKTMREIGANLGISEDAAKMRVNRALEKLRKQFAGRGITCTAAVLGVLVTKHSVEAAPSEVFAALAALRAPVAAGAGAGIGALTLLLHIPKIKLASGVAAVLLIGAATVLLLHSAVSRRSQAVINSQQARSASLSAATNKAAAVSMESGTNADLLRSGPDAHKLLQDMVRARQQIISGEVEFEIATYSFNSPLDGTSHVHAKAVFDGPRRRFESHSIEYAYASMADDAAEVTEAKRRTERLDRQAAVRAGLLKEFGSHDVAAFDGTTFMDYSEDDGRLNDGKYTNHTTTIRDLAKEGSIHAIFDPRLFGLDDGMSASASLEDFLSFTAGLPGSFVGEELVEGVPAWHVRLQKDRVRKDFWFDSAHPARILKEGGNVNRVSILRYDLSRPEDVMPTEVLVTDYGTSTNGIPRYEKRTKRIAARFNVPVDPSSWTLAGLGMQAGSEVFDHRNSAFLGYWNGSGLDEGLPRKGEKTSTPDHAELMALLENFPASPAGFDAAQWILLNSPDGREVEKAAEVILQEHIQETNLVTIAQQLERMRHRCTTNLLQAMLEQNPDPRVRGNACLTLATLRKEAAEFGENKAATAEAERLFERVEAEFGSVKKDGKTLSELARPELFELRRLSIGNPALEIEGEDLEGDSLKLSNYKGKVVVLRFWADCCVPSDLKKIEEKMAGKPVQLIGVNCDITLKRAQAVVDKQEITWPSFNDGRDGPIATAWNVNSWPTTFVLDRRGIIRFRNPLGPSLAQAVDELLGE
jgi:RNA polymerase sigma factor (sigma-70 family)